MIHLDEQQCGQYNLLSDMQSHFETIKELDLISKLNPSFKKDGDKFCYLYGEMPNDCVVGFGNTAAEAMRDFCRAFWNDIAVNNEVKTK